MVKGIGATICSRFRYIELPKFRGHPFLFRFDGALGTIPYCTGCTNNAFGAILHGKLLEVLFERRERRLRHLSSEIYTSGMPHFWQKCSHACGQNASDVIAVRKCIPEIRMAWITRAESCPFY